MQSLRKIGDRMKIKREYADLSLEGSGFIMKYRHIFVALIFLMQAALANYLAFIIRFDGILSTEYLKLYGMYLPLLLFVRFAFFFREGLYKGLWRYASTSDLIKIIKSTTIGSILFLIVVHYLLGDTGYPRSVFILDWMLCILISGGNRLLIRMFREYMFVDPSRKKILIVGAGDAAEMIVREMKSGSNYMYEPIGFIDDLQKIGLTIHGVPILGNCKMISEIVNAHKPDEILISVSDDMHRTIKEVYDSCKPFNIPIKKLPGIHDLLDGNVTVGAKLGQRLLSANLATEENIQEALALQEKEGGRLGAKLIKLGHIAEDKLLAFLSKQYGITHMKPISLEDLLQRESVKTDNTAVMNFLKGKSVIVTGAGGSIGSELCRQIIKYKPSHLLLLDRYENTLYEVDIELRNEGNDVHLSSIIVDIQDRLALESLFSKHKPQVVFHAAAYKHVPLMEVSPIEAVKNNILGTKNIIDTAAKYGAESFVLVSTDKAVNPTSVMGATKRIAEFLTINMNGYSKTRFSTVRFGNVLGSNGSVVPIFKEQLKNGGPLTVTHPEIERFFMLIPEAVQLVLIAASSGAGGELFVLDMGKPVKIAEFAENFIRLSGYIPHEEIQIKFTGLRPGEKLYEELFDKTEKSIPTLHSKLMIAIPEVPSLSSLKQYVSELEHAVLHYAVEEVESIMHKIVPNYGNGNGNGNGNGQPMSADLEEHNLFDSISDAPSTLHNKSCSGKN
jgi:FlaA1/EpsC-like NDP-sugar epimerase